MKLELPKVTVRSLRILDTVGIAVLAFGAGFGAPLLLNFWPFQKYLIMIMLTLSGMGILALHSFLHTWEIRKAETDGKLVWKALFNIAMLRPRDYFDLSHEIFHDIEED